MNTGKTVYAQLMDFLPWTTFARIVERYDGDRRVRTLSCGEQYRAMAFAQLTWRKSLRDIETCLSVHASKLCHMGCRQPVRRSTLAEANEGRDWRIHSEVAQRLIAQARKLYADEDLALDATTIDPCLSVFPWAHFRTTKAAVKMHTRWIRGATSRAASTSRTASCTTFTPYLRHGSRLRRFHPPSRAASGRWSFSSSGSSSIFVSSGSLARRKTR